MDMLYHKFIVLTGLIKPRIGILLNINMEILCNSKRGSGLFCMITAGSNCYILQTFQSSLYLTALS